ncbi:molybdate ABC transporter substrate-binding protein [Niallia circulans]
MAKRRGMMKKHFQPIILLITILILASCSNKQGQSAASKQEPISLTISAAASMQDALESIKEKFEKEHPDITLTFNFGSSGALQQQISQGAPVDLFLSAAEDKMALLIKDGFIRDSDHMNLVKNNLVLITNKQADTTIDNFADLETLDTEKSLSVYPNPFQQEIMQKKHCNPCIYGKRSKKISFLQRMYAKFYLM